MKAIQDFTIGWCAIEHLAAMFESHQNIQAKERNRRQAHQARKKDDSSCDLLNEKYSV